VRTINNNINNNTAMKIKSFTVHQATKFNDPRKSYRNHFVGCDLRVELEEGETLEVAMEQARAIARDKVDKEREALLSRCNHQHEFEELKRNLKYKLDELERRTAGDKAHIFNSNNNAMSTLAIKPLPPELQLGAGSHSDPERGMSLLEAASYVAGEPFSDHPKCVCPALAGFGRNLNDVLPDDQRQRLLPFVPRLLGTADDGKLQERGIAAARWLITVYTPTFLDLAGIEHKLRELPINSWDDVVAAQPQLDDAKQRAAAARAAAWALSLIHI
jgi:hypothetical protein